MSYSPTLPKILDDRIKGWRNDPPKWQHKTYGPLNAYFILLFPPTHFLVKPQSLLRGEAHVEPYGEIGYVSDQSYDSHDAAVTSERRYPDFCIDQYWGAEGYPGFKPDIVRIVIEVGSLRDETNRDSAARQLIRQVHNGMEDVGDRWKGWLLGLAILGTDVYMAQMRKDGNDPEKYILDPKGTFGANKWYPLFGPKMKAELAEAHKYFIAHHNDP